MDVAIVTLPLLGALIAGLGNRRLGDRGAMWITSGLMLVSFVLSWIVFLQYDGTPRTTELFTWFASGTFEAKWAVKVDQLSAVMLVVVTTVSSMVHVYSIGYMSHDHSKPRFFAYLSLFTFCMLMLVTADNFIQMFFGWEGVGLCSYLLIGFWFHKPSANAAAIKAFIVNRIGDFGFALGIMGVFFIFGTVGFDAVFAATPGKVGQTFHFLSWDVDILTALCLLLFVGAMGKSAQLGLHTWLPDAMEGPTPVSALIHAATMVTAGVFMVCRLSPMFEYAPDAKMVVAIVGAATAFFAATVGLVQNDIKRVIAYSTCSQLGYMFFAAGVGAYGAAMFHLFTHAFFKALLFLGAGSVIHAMHHEQDMRYYGALRKSIPLTFWAMLIGTLAITGVGLDVAGGIGFAGFWSKDAIIDSAWANGSVPGVIAFWIGVLVAGMTSFYSWRLVFMTFFGEPRWAASEHVQHAVHHVHEAEGSEGDHDAAHAPAHAPLSGTAGYHPHESPLTMLVPICLLAVGALFAGQFFHGVFVDGDSAPRYWNGIISFSRALAESVESSALWVKLSPTIAMLIGLWIAWNNYVRSPGAADRFVATFPSIYRFVFNKWYFDELYD